MVVSARPGGCVRVLQVQEVVERRAGLARAAHHSVRPSSSRLRGERTVGRLTVDACRPPRLLSAPTIAVPACPAPSALVAVRDGPVVIAAPGLTVSKPTAETATAPSMASRLFDQPAPLKRVFLIMLRVPSRSSFAALHHPYGLPHGPPRAERTCKGTKGLHRAARLDSR